VETKPNIVAPEVALIDADIVLHRVGFTTEKDEFWIAKARADEMLDGILLDTGVTRFELWISDSSTNNFRYKLYPKYKANRTKPKPKHHETLKAYLISEWGARFSEGMEADDYLGILQDEEGQSTVICSIDKDLKQIPGLHYDFVKKEWHTISWEQATTAFFEQVAIGDVSDNIPGLYGIGPTKARRHFDGVRHGDVSNYYDDHVRALRQLYQTVLSKEWGLPWTQEKETALWGQILLTGRLIKIKRSFTEPLWGSQLLPLMEEYCASFIQDREEVIPLFTEPTIPEKREDGFPLAGLATDITVGAETAPVTSISGAT
jgi:hypothetical protein